MVTKAENELLTRVGSDAPMGRLMRENYWIPFALSSHLTVGAAPMPVRLLGENYVAFRGENGAIGFFDELCPHRRASLTLARVEGDALRCIYHGWKIDVGGCVVDVPTQTVRPTEFAKCVPVAHFPVREAGGLAWVWLAGGQAPAFPELPFAGEVEANSWMSVSVAPCNWLQGVEGTLDSVHAGTLHYSWLQEAARLQADSHLGLALAGPPTYDTEAAPYGLQAVALRPTADGAIYARVTQFFMPLVCVVPFGRARPQEGSVFAFAPVDDHNHLLFYGYYSDEPQGLPVDMGVMNPNYSPDPRDFTGLRGDRGNLWGQDRELIKAGHLTGFGRTLLEEDIVVQTSMGAIVDRSKEFLSSSDVAVVHTRRLLLEALAGAEVGKLPPGSARTPTVVRMPNALEFVYDQGGDWRDVVASLYVTDFSTVDYFTDPSLIVAPYEYLDYLRSQCPVYREPHHDVLAVTGYDEAVAIYRDDDSFSSCNVVGGPFPGLPVEPEGDDITELIEQYRHVFPLSENFTTFDPPEHTKLRTLLMRLITPRRMRDNEEFMGRLGQRLMDGFVDKGRVDFVNEFAHPFSLLVIADFLGVPEEDHEWFKVGFQAPKPLGSIDGETYQGGHLAFLEDSFTKYIEDRRGDPREDALTKLAQARYPDGSLPEVVDVVRMAAMLFAAGKGTAVHLFATATMFLAEQPELQEQLRQNRDLLASFIEEALRLESPNKVVFRLARKTTSVGGVDIPAGSTVMLMNSAVNRDPRRFEDPSELRTDRPNPMEHLAFGRGTHACPGGPLARAEARVVLNLVLDRMGDIRLSEDHHGPMGQRRFRYQPSYFSRILEELQVEFTPIG